MVQQTNEPRRERQKAEQLLEQAKERLAQAKKKENAERRKAENHYKYMIGGIVAKYFPECYLFDESELRQILSDAIHSRECQARIKGIKEASAGDGDSCSHFSAARQGNGQEVGDA